ncbi:MAG TPA: UDP-N-acetylmuramoyl-L-alanyl-D-glutamate--2,6-diaminopimelate ligase, partial [Xanthomonadales bacterium]|nr:UDP-N-acetylmuramoyl-L-alanyl-D-glutamate--2,6-diaminopimelate ligase [Xanthomonadales bacterium]
ISYQMGEEQIPAPHTTPESADLQEILAKMRDRGLEYVVMEVSSHALEQDRVFGTDFDIALFTNLTQDHLDYHITMEEYFGAKLRLFQDLKPKGAIKIRGVINLDDPWGRQIIGEMKFPCLSYSLTDKGDIIARECSVGSDGVSFTAVTPVGKFSIKSKLAGRHNIQNMLASIGAACALDIPAKVIQEGIAGVENVPGRLEKVSEGQDFEVFVDYAHTEDALRNLLSAAKEITRGKIITVFGCGGDRDRGKRPKMGKAASDMSDIMIITSDNPRGEDPLAIIEEIETGISGLKRGKDYFAVEDRSSAIKMAINLAMPGDTVILAGKGHEDYQIIGGKRLHFDDREASRDAIRERPSRQRGKP